MALLVACKPADPVEAPAPVCTEAPAPALGPVTSQVCDAPAEVDPEAVDDREAYWEVASAVVCDVGLRCGGWLVLGQSYCHPEFARREAQRESASSRYDPERGRTCLRRLMAATTCDAALDIALTCRDISLGALGRSCSDSSDCWGFDEVCSPETGRCVWLDEGDACTDTCGPGLTCVDGRCRQMEGCSCESHDECGPHARCLSGVCRRATEGEACGSDTCAEGLFCDDSTTPPTCAVGAGPGEPCVGGGCAVGQCSDGVCQAQHHLGCGCEADTDCPWDVARCHEGVCVARPMLGDACDPDGPPCFGARCYDGTCDRIRDGDGPCSTSGECVEGLTCSAEPFEPGLCGAPRAEREPCGPEHPGRCEDGLHCSTSESPICVPPSPIGSSCADRPCVDGARCADDVCERDDSA